MKKALLFLLVFACKLTIAQIQEGTITYKCEILQNQRSPSDTLAKLDQSDLGFSITFSKDKAYVFEKYHPDRHAAYIYDKASSEVLTLGVSNDQKSFAYSKSTGQIIRAYSHLSYSDEFFELNESKKILGYNCRKVMQNYGDRGRAIMWITDEIDPKTRLQDSPLTLPSPALEYTFMSGSSMLHYIATEVNTSIEDYTLFEEHIPDGYGFIVPISLCAPENDPVTPLMIDPDIDFITYPSYPPGRVSLAIQFRDLPKDPNESRFLAHSGSLVTCTIDKEGNLSNFKVPLTENEEMRDAVIKIMETVPKWNPATVKGEPVVSHVRIQITFSIR